jgi:hypothetical protein
VENFSGYWTGSFEGTNSGGLSFTISQDEKALSGFATTHEPAFGISEYTIIGEIGPPAKFQLLPTKQIQGLIYGVIHVNCTLVNNEMLNGRWQSTTGTNGAFTARRYKDPALDQTWKAEHKNVFISYRHTDKEYLDELTVHLRPLEKSQRLDIWSDQRIKAGAQWKHEIESALQRAHFAVLLVSSDYLASDFIVDNELPVLLTKAKEQGVRILPLILRPCRFSRDTHLNGFQAINSPDIPLTSLDRWERDKYYDRIAREIEDMLGEEHYLPANITN